MNLNDTAISASRKLVPVTNASGNKICEGNNCAIKATGIRAVDDDTKTEECLVKTSRARHSDDHR